MTRRENKLLWREIPGGGGLVFAPERIALTLHRIHSATEHSRTWGEFRRAMPPNRIEFIYEPSLENEELLPRDEEELSDLCTPSWGDGDYPEWLRQTMET